MLLGDILSAVTAPAAVRAFEAAAAEGRDPAQVLTAYGAASNARTAAGAVTALRMSPSSINAPSTSSAVPSPWFGRGVGAQFAIG